MAVRDGLLFCLECDENTGTTAADALGNYAGTLANGATWGAGKIGASSVAIAPSNDTLTMASITQFVNAAQLSVGCWMNKAAAGVDYAAIFSFFHNANDRVEIHMGGSGLGSTTNLNFNITNASSGSNGYNASGGGNVAFSTATWYHLLMVYDGTATGNANRLKMFIDGVQQTLTFSSTIPALTSSASPTTTYWGLRGVGTVLPFSGLLDQLCGWNRVVTPEEAAYIVNGGAGRAFALWDAVESYSQSAYVPPYNAPTQPAFETPPRRLFF